MAKVLRAKDFFDLSQYHQRVEHSRKAWAELLAGKRPSIVFMNLCAPFLCDLFDIKPEDYYTDLQVMAETQLRGIAWRLENLDEDEIPLAVFLDQGTVHEALAFNLPIFCKAGSTPWGSHLITDIREVDTLEPPDLTLQHNLLETRRKLAAMRHLIEGLPVLASVHLHAPFTMAAQLFNAQDLFVACYEEPARVHKLLSFCVRFFMHFERVKHQYGLSPKPLDEFICWREAHLGKTRVWMSDDTASMLSPQLYQEFALPYNQALFTAFEITHLHMDGGWDYLIPLVQSLQPGFCEVGGETKWEAVVADLGDTTVLQGGILAETARGGTPAECASAVHAALGTAKGKARVALTIANEVHPGTPLENMQAIIEAGRRRQQS
jgi:uroporphyrinogen-III decarboxylase